MGHTSSNLSRLALNLTLGGGLVGCGSVWDLREGDVLPIGCVEVTTFIDADGDGWGGPGEFGQVACVTALPQGAAGNDLDCDDDDPGITGFVSRSCPGDLDPDSSVAGLVVGQREFVAFEGDSDPARYTTAAARCEGWADETSEDAPEGQRGLATLTDSTELLQVPEWLQELSSIETGYAAFVDLRWDADEEAWRWPDGSAPDGFPFCSTPPPLEDFLVDLAPADEKAAEALLDEIADEARLALIRTDGGWCWGAPAEGQGFGPQEALAICERPSPNPVDYPTVAPGTSE